MTETPDYRELAADCRAYAARCAIPAHAAALLEAAVIYERRAAEAEADAARDVAPIRPVPRAGREASPRV
jgi:hypothetical protein